jgi:pimeloyl-ACP methyl ester carboxylesterase
MRKRRVGSLAVRESGDPADPGVLLWPGLGATGAYFESFVGELPGRVVAVDPPGLGGSAPLGRCSLERLIEMACAVVEQCECRAVVGHSLGAFVAVGVAAKPPAGLLSAVLIDGGFMQAEDMVRLGMPLTAGRAKLVEWLGANSPRFSDWGTATRELATMVGGRESRTFRAYVRDVFVEIDGEVRERMTADQAADLLLATYDHDPAALARTLELPTLLIACGQPAAQRDVRQQAWEAFAARSSLIELHVAEDWSHNPIFQDPEVLTALIAGWLRRHR